MSIIPNPYLLFGSLVAALLCFLSGFYYGTEYQRGKQALDVTAFQKQIIDDANNSIEVETRRSLASAKQEAEKRASFQILKLKGERDAALKAKFDCSRDPTSMGLLLDTIRSANGEETASNQLSKSVSAIVPTP